MSVFEYRFRRTNITAQCPYLRVIDVALSDMEARRAAASNKTNIMQQPEVQRKVHHTGLTILAAPKNHA